MDRLRSSIQINPTTKDESKKSFIAHKDDFQWRVQIDDRDELHIFRESIPEAVVSMPYIFGPKLSLADAKARCDELRSIEWIDKKLELCYPWHSNLSIAKPLSTPAYLPIGNEIAFLEKEIQHADISETSNIADSLSLYGNVRM